MAFEVHDLQAAVDRAATDGYRLVGGIGEYEDSWPMAYVQGPEGIIVSLAERIGYRLAHWPDDRRAAHSWSRMDISTSSYQRPSCSTDSRRRPSSVNPAFW